MNNPSNKSSSRKSVLTSPDLSEAERENRLRALRSMLASTEARQGQTKRGSNQALAAGLSVQILTGSDQGAAGVIIDADYIRSRVLVELRNGASSTWVNFPDVLPIIDSDEEDSNSLQSD